MRLRWMAPALCLLALLALPQAAGAQAYAPAPPAEHPLLDQQRRAVNRVLRGGPGVPRSVARHGLSQRDLDRGVFIPRSGDRRARVHTSSRKNWRAVGDVPKVAARAGLGTSPASNDGYSGGAIAAAIAAALLGIAAVATLAARRRAAKR